MKTILKKNNGLNNKWIILLLLFTSVDTVLFGTNGNRLFLWVPRIVGLISILLMMLLIKNKNERLLKVNKYSFFCFALMSVLFFSSAVYNGMSFETTISRFIAIFVAYIITRFISENEFLCIFDDFLFFISIIALLTEVLAYIMPMLLNFLPKVLNTTGYVYSSFFVGGLLITTNVSETFIRASSIFWEPGAYAFYLILGIMYQLFKKEKINSKRLIVYIISLIITFSTTGYIVLGVMMIADIMSRKLNNKSNVIKYLCAIIAFLVIIVSLFSQDSVIYQAVFAKLFSGTSSATTRYSSLFNGIKVALSHPLLGVGDNLDKYMEIYVKTSQYSNGGLSITNTIVAQAASYGCLFGLLFLVGTLNFFRRWNSSKKTGYILAFSIVLAYMGERFYSFLPFVFVFYGFTKYTRRNLDESSNY